MQKLKKLYVDSIMELNVTHNMVICGLMAALAVAGWGITKGVKALRRKIEEGGY